jgi:L-ascorbate metabolism protein UlaG (beta-lactamase superfamily)
VRYLGVSGFEIVGEHGHRIVVDPCLSGDPALDVPASPVSVRELDGVDVVLVTHGAWDHRGDAYEITRRSAAVLVCGPEVRLNALRCGVPDAQIRKAITGTVYESFAGRIRTVPACHLSLISDDTGVFAGPAVGFVIETPGGTRLYHSGDTSLFGDLRLIGERYQPDVAFVCVGETEHGLTPLPPDEAVIAVRWLGSPRVVIPMHHCPGDPEPDVFERLMKAHLPHIATMRLNPGDWTRLGPFGGTT